MSDLPRIGAETDNYPDRSRDGFVSSLTMQSMFFFGIGILSFAS
ncbi:hypothetical protein [Desmospora profundinema]|uniref:MFS transporter n=1 Tax=Desmospora profundinema TaxID=1571184 RepID=A0ABU1IRK4_9BACL|nr:hypothetical protein [Desmospora profundinema]MDR6227432.1 hypothetical protein [Desmospora profundinema]